MNKDFLRAYPTYAPYQDVLCEIFEKPSEVFAERFPHLAKAWEPFFRSLFDHQFDIDSIRKAASDNRDFQQWLLDINVALSDIPPSLIDEFIDDVRARFRQRNGRSMDTRAVLDVCQAIDCFLSFAAEHSHPVPKPPAPGADL